MIVLTRSGLPAVRALALAMVVLLKVAMLVVLLKAVILGVLKVAILVVLLKVAILGVLKVAILVVLLKVAILVVLLKVVMLVVLLQAMVLHLQATVVLLKAMVVLLQAMVVLLKAMVVLLKAMVPLLQATVLLLLKVVILVVSSNTLLLVATKQHCVWCSNKMFCVFGKRVSLLMVAVQLAALLLLGLRMESIAWDACVILGSIAFEASFHHLLQRPFAVLFQLFKLLSQLYPLDIAMLEIIRSFALANCLTLFLLPI